MGRNKKIDSEKRNFLFSGETLNQIESLCDNYNLKMTDLIEKLVEFAYEKQNRISINQVAIMVNGRAKIKKELKYK